MNESRCDNASGWDEQVSSCSYTSAHSRFRSVPHSLLLFFLQVLFTFGDGYL